MSDHTPQPSALKVCAKCGEAKPREQFAKDRNRKDGLQPYCRSCHAAMRQERYWGDEEHRLKQRAQWREYRQRPEVQQKKLEWDKRRGYRTSEVSARSVVGTAVTRGKFPPAWTMVCEICQEAQAAHWHHHNGYDKAHWLDVVAVCRDCHGVEHWRAGND